MSSPTRADTGELTGAAKDRGGPVLAAAPAASEPRLERCEGRAWCALHTRARHEKKVAARSSLLGVPTYLPLRISRTVSGGKVNTFFVPMFPGYVFAALAPGDVGELKRSNSLAQWVPTRDEVSLLSALRSVRTIELARVELELTPRFYPGQQVMIGEGPLAGVTGTIYRQKNRTRFQVTVEAIGQTVVVDVPADALVAI